MATPEELQAAAQEQIEAEQRLAEEMARAQAEAEAFEELMRD